MRQKKRNIIPLFFNRIVFGIVILISILCFLAYYFFSKSSEIPKKVTAVRTEALNVSPIKDSQPQPYRPQSPETSPEYAPASASPTQTPSRTLGHDNPNEISVLVNKKNPLNPIDFRPQDLTSYQGFLISSKMSADLRALLTAASAANNPVDLYSTFRSYNNQAVAYNHWVRVNGSQEAADRVSARPGYSEHQTGFAVDFSYGSCSLQCFTNSDQYIWLKNNAHKYGFIERYPEGFENITGYSAESWHWRYVGMQTATSMLNRGIKTLEQLWDMPGGGY